MESIKEFIYLLAIFGVPSIFTMVMFIIATLRSFRKTNEYLMNAVKSIIRNQLIKDYQDYEQRCQNGGKITIVELDEWLNRYKAYHNLVGDNGVLDDKYKRILDFDLKKGDD